MKHDIKKPSTRRRTKVRGGSRSGRGGRLYASIPVAKGARRRSSSLGAERSVALAAAVCLTLAMIALFVMPDYAIGAINISGNQGTPTEDIRNAIGFADKHNAFLLRSRDVVSAIKALPGVKQVEARIRLPGQLDVIVHDEAPEVFWQTSSQSLWLDSKGVVGAQPPQEPERKLIIKDTSGRTYAKGDKVDAAAISGARTLSLLLPREIQTLEFQREGELIVISNQGWSALFNTRGDLGEQVNALQRTLSGAHATGMLDVRVPGVVGVRPTVTR